MLLEKNKKLKKEKEIKKRKKKRRMRSGEGRRIGRQGKGQEYNGLRKRQVIKWLKGDILSTNYQHLHIHLCLRNSV